MRVSAELTGRRFALALLFLAVLPGLALATAAAYQRPDPLPGPAAYDPVPLPDVPLLDGLYLRERGRSQRLAAGASQRTGPQLVPATFPEPEPTLVLAPRSVPYDLAELTRSVPEAFQPMPGAVLVRAAIEVPVGATLTIDSATTPDVRLLSSPTGFVTVIADGGSIDVRGTRQTPARISSWNPDAGRVDDDPTDGRALMLEIGGRMDVAHADIGHLGFGTGSSSGVAWRGADHAPGTPPIPTTGTVSNSVLHDNWFGAYTFEAERMLWRSNTFANNGAYGFDPHDLSNYFTVEHNVAYGNGRHGFIFSRGCQGNVLRNNLAYANRGHGFMIDDGPSEDATAVLPSNNNRLVANRAHDNDGSGIEIEGGTGTLIRNNTLERNHVGVRVKDGASAVVESNQILHNNLAGVDVLDGAGRVRITGNDIGGGWAGIALGRAADAYVHGNQIVGVSTPVVENGKAVRNRSVVTVLGEVFRWKPELIMWTVILCCPALLAAWSIVRVRWRVGRHRSGTGRRRLPSVETT
jgi:parallel beta-helix repeat protein